MGEPASYDRQDVVAGAWWATCCVEDLYEIEGDEVDDIRESSFDPGEPVGARVWPSRDDALADPDIQADIRDGFYSEQTADRLGLPTLARP